ncbi:hypothetical protein KKC13_04480 [bacterium]|nr:hypothetical protein [bacterium]MBU1958250.1 hypothetical protein [bacterium]
MKKIIHTIPILPLLFSTVLLAEDKHLILAEGNTWLPMMPKNLIDNHNSIKKLPFSGFVMVGDSFTDRVMKADETLTYEEVWSEIKGLQHLYKNKHNFMQVNIHFPADFWDDKAWNRVAKNFGVVAKITKDLHFKGIVFDDEPYSTSALQMINFKFPSKEEISKKPTHYQAWEKKGSEDTWVDSNAYRNPNYTFEEHSKKITSRFKSIMQAMVKENPNLSLLVYNGPSFSHENSNKKSIIVTDVGLPREHEHMGAIYLGFKQGLDANATLHDMGESYRYRADKHFKNAYQWRKEEIAKNEFNDDLNASYQWIVPKEDRASWSSQSHVGFMVFNKGQESNHDEYDTRKKSTPSDIQATLEKALHYSDNYVIYYCQDQDWLLPNQNYPLAKAWREMMQEVNFKKNGY